MSDTSADTHEAAEGDESGRPEVIRPDDVSAQPADGAVSTDGASVDGDGAGAGAGQDDGGGDLARGDAVTEPGKVMRIGSMIKQLLEEVRSTELDEPSRERLAEVYERSVTELSSALSTDLSEELKGLALPFEGDETPSDAELRVAKAQLVGWLEGLFHGIQASLMAQQYAAQQQLQQMRELPGEAGGPQGQPPQQRPQPPQTGTYL